MFGSSGTQCQTYPDPPLRIPEQWIPLILDPSKYSSEFFHTPCIILGFIFIVLYVLSHILLTKTEATFCCIYEETEAQLKFVANFI